MDTEAVFAEVLAIEPNAARVVAIVREEIAAGRGITPTELLSGVKEYVVAKPSPRCACGAETGTRFLRTCSACIAKEVA